MNVNNVKMTATGEENEKEFLTFSTIPRSPFDRTSLAILAALYDTATEDETSLINNGTPSATAMFVYVRYNPLS